jgi:hypothetical protein
VLLEIKGDLPCYCDTLRVHTSDDGGYRSRAELVLLSMFGPRNAVRAAWAKLFKAASRGGHRDSIEVGEQHVSLSDRAYFTVTAPIGRGLLHSVIFHSQLGHNAPDLGYLYQTGPAAERRYFDRLTRWCPVPMRTTWREPLWELGKAAGAVLEVRGHGREAWRVDTTREVWEPILTTAIREGALR